MRSPRTVLVVGTALASFLTAVAAGTPAQADPGGRPAVRHVGQISEQDIPPLPGSEPDTLVEPDIAVSPVNPNIAVAASHDGRYPDGGAVAIGYAWTHDGGRTWHHAPLPGITTSVGGVWDRASDPVVAFGPDGTAYISTLLISLGCPNGVGVSRSTDGGRTFSPPVLVHVSDSCAYSDDKPWLVVDNGRHSPHRGRLYQFWTPFLTDAQGDFIAAPQVLRWSDDRGQHWSDTVTVSATDISSQNSQPMIQPDGTLVDTYMNLGTAEGDEGPERPGVDAAATGVQRSAAQPAVTPEGDLMVARVSHDGGRTWSQEYPVTQDVGFGPPDIRCCVPSAAADPVTGLLYAAWMSATPELVRLSVSSDGQHWSSPRQVNRDDQAGMQHVNIDVSAYGGRVFVSYGSRDTTVAAGRFVQQKVSTSLDLGRHFGPAIALGPPSDLRYAAFARGLFPGDYIGGAATHGRTYLVWCRSSTPPDPAARFHQTMFGAVLVP